MNKTVKTLMTIGTTLVVNYILYKKRDAIYKKIKEIESKVKTTEEMYTNHEGVCCVDNNDDYPECDIYDECDRRMREIYNAIELNSTQKALDVVMGLFNGINTLDIFLISDFIKICKDLKVLSPNFEVKSIDNEFAWVSLDNIYINNFDKVIFAVSKPIPLSKIEKNIETNLDDFNKMFAEDKEDEN